MSLTFNSRKNKFQTNDGLVGFRISNNYKNTNETNDGLAGFRIVDNYRGDNGRSIITSRDILATDGTFGDELGFSVAISGNRAVVSSFKTVGSNQYQGAVYLYDVGTENLLTELTATDGTSNDYFGYSVGINNSFIVVGVPYKTINGNSNQGACYLYDISGTFISELTATDGATDDYFGNSVAINKNNRFIVGSYLWDNTSAKGKAYIYDIVNNLPVLVSQLTATDGLNNDRFGYSVAISDSFAVIGAPYKDGQRGSAYLYNISASPTFVTELTAFDRLVGDYFGYSMAISENFVIVGSPYKDSNKGVVYIYNTGGNFVSKLTAFDGADYDLFGYSVAISENNLLVGASQNGLMDVGMVYIYNMSTNPPTFVKKIFQNSYSAPLFGFSVAVDGSNGIAGFPDDNNNNGSIGGFSFIKNIS